MNTKKRRQYKEIVADSIIVTRLNATKGYIFDEYSEDLTEDNYPTYKRLVREYGKCTGKVYVDTSEGAKAIGYVFVKTVEYQDSSDTYLEETWVSFVNRKQ
jgi:hypothetical protein